MSDTLQRSSRLHLAIQDVLEGAKLQPLWGKLGWNDILQRYRRSFLGPFWIRISMAVMAIARNASILVLASHNLKVCRKWCNKALWLNNGQMQAFGPSEDVIDAFEATIQTDRRKTG